MCGAKRHLEPTAALVADFLRDFEVLVDPMPLVVALQDELGAFAARILPLVADGLAARKGCYDEAAGLGCKRSVGEVPPQVPPRLCPEAPRISAPILEPLDFSRITQNAMLDLPTDEPRDCIRTTQPREGLPGSIGHQDKMDHEKKAASKICSFENGGVAVAEQSGPSKIWPPRGSTRSVVSKLGEEDPFEIRMREEIKKRAREKTE
jgi:hypothetical protein